MFGDTWVWNGAGWRELKGQSPPARYAHAMAFDSRRGIVVMYGGATMTADRQTAHLEDMWQWDGGRWTEIKLTGKTPGNGTRRRWHTTPLADAWCCTAASR
jgi:hypothetical protein